ncbi:hypothetical protein CYMTET_19355 [Cymbomonas tetramitiformis]|uniref:Uncharacterized protein n=1 Tax=Cymbomonas tetramitiformis TaxID=36881 RepID=A0AAE0L4Z4_9CHLO|nr:hypothetical protein CYMTET_45658 [Cymbomonas tetramitiformis]KAK3272356.1 hypothetical protein CYMTET_19355 [Cymbomonas tetramitiformis]
MSMQLDFNEPEQKVSANSFTPTPPWISSTHDSAVVIETHSEDDEDDSVVGYMSGGADTMPEQVLCPPARECVADRRWESAAPRQYP